MSSNRKKRSIGSDSPQAAASAAVIVKSKEYIDLFDHALDLVLINSSIVAIPFPIDALVNCTGPYFEHNVGVSKAIYQHVGGAQLDDEFDSYLETHQELEYGVVHDTPAFNLTNHKHLLHIRSPTARNKHKLVNGRQVSLIEITYHSLLKRAFVDMGLESVAMPLIGTGAAGVTVQDCTFDLVTAVHKFLTDFSPLMNGKKHTVYLVNNSSNILIEAEVYLSRKISSLNGAAASASSGRVVGEKCSKLNKTEDDEEEDEKEEEVSTSSSASSPSADNEECVICLETIKDEKKLELCTHSFCRHCIDTYFETVKKHCPVCNTSYGVSQGNQPNGTMTHRFVSTKLAGFESTSVGTIEITYAIPSGIQDRRHPNPGTPYHGCTRIAYLPDTNEGRRVLELLKRAFDQKLVFTVGQSRTTGQDNMVTWNDIHHKTSMYGGTTGFGYPDPTYLNRVVQELADKGIS